MDGLNFDARKTGHKNMNKIEPSPTMLQQGP